MSCYLLRAAKTGAPNMRDAREAGRVRDEKQLYSNTYKIQSLSTGVKATQTEGEDIRIQKLSKAQTKEVPG